MKILILCDHYPLSPRVKKIRDSILKLKTVDDIKIFVWNRSDEIIREDYVIGFSQEIGYGKKFKKIWNLMKFVSKVKAYAKEYNPDFMHAIDLEMLAVGTIMNTDSRIVYEIYDIKSFKNSILNILREKLEVYLINKKVNAMIFASPFFVEYYNHLGVKETPQIVINNKPKKNIKTVEVNRYMEPYVDKLAGKIVIGFIGSIRYKEILVNLIDASVNCVNVVVLLSGSGSDYLYIKDYIDKNDYHDKVIMTGRFEEEDLSTIYNYCDYVWAAYPNKDLKVKYAISNKYFESLALNKPVIVSDKTMLGDYVIKENTGYVIDPYNKKEICKLLQTFNSSESQIEKSSCLKGDFWEDEEEQLALIYKNKINI